MDRPSASSMSQDETSDEMCREDELSLLKEELEKLHNGTHEGYNISLKRLENEFHERRRINSISRNLSEESVEREYQKEIQSARTEFQEKREELKRTLIADLLEQRERIEFEHRNTHLLTERMIRPPFLRQRTKDQGAIPGPSRDGIHSESAPNIALRLKDEEIEADIRAIQRGKGGCPKRKSKRIS